VAVAMAVAVTSSVLDRTHTIIGRGHRPSWAPTPASVRLMLHRAMASGLLAAAIVMARAHTARA
jgi:hypothetical protein